MRAPRPIIPEPVDPEAVSPAGPYRALKQLGLVLLCAAWVALGLAGHDPWKTEDATSIGVAASMAKAGDFVIPTLAGEPYVPHPPLAYISGMLSIELFSPPLQVHNAARLVVGLALALVLLATACASRELNGRAFRWLPVLILVGSVGFWDRAHVLSPELFMTLGIAVALYGFARALRRPLAGGAMLGVGVAVAFLGRGTLGPLWIIGTAFVLPACGPEWRNRAYAATLATALLVAIALSLPWPLMLHARDPALFVDWWASDSPAQHVAVLAGGSAEPLYYLRNLLWFAWPALPLIVWLLWLRGRGFNGGMAQPGIAIPGVLALVILVSLLTMPEARLANALPLLVPLALLAALEVDSLKRGFSGALDWFGILTFGLLAVVMWFLWIDSYVNGMPANVARLFRDTETGYRPSFHLGTMLAAIGLTVLWIMLVRPARRSNRRALLNWAVGVTLIWGLVTTIWLPYLDSRRSYRWTVENVAQQLPPEGCIASRNLGEPQRALFDYFAAIRTVREEVQPDHACEALLVQYGRQVGDIEPLPGWAPAWSGGRKGDDTERFVLYLKTP
ncbi:MAG: glycosyltransferase family 39 protein [Burkholderiales bacterium]|nr:glycosyltransferase family 39 protein [Burkholderiales bacterium]